VADHVVEVAIGGLASGPLRVLCRQENGRRSANLFAGVLSSNTANHPAPGEHAITHRHDDDPGPVAA
jgi:hypothetical protein